jgi:DNA repair exonuclease SbcCD ATPase subunit
MDILNLRIANFLTIGDSGDLALTGKGLVLIQGKNEDDPSATSNGSGKSSIPDALCWALYGMTARGASGDAVVNNKAKKDCLVQVVLRDGDSVYMVARYRKHKDFKNSLRVWVWNPASTYPKGTAVDMTRGTDKETQTLVEQIMGCSYDVFKAAIYAGQEQMPDLPGMTDKELKLLIEQAAGTERLERAYEIARTKHNAKLAEKQTRSAWLDSLTLRLTSAKSDVLTAEQARDLFEAGREGRQKTHQATATTHAVAMKAAHAEFTAANEPMLKTELDTLNEQLGRHSKLQVELRAIERFLADLNADVQLHESDLKRALADREKCQRQIDEAPTVGLPCRACGKPHTADDLKVVHENLLRELLEPITRAKEIVGKIKAAKEKRDACVLKRDAFAKTIPDVSVSAARVAAINAKLHQIAGIRSRIVMLKKDYDNAQAAADRALTETNPHASAVALAQDKVKSFEAEIAKVQIEVAKLEEEAAIAESVAKVFGPAGVRAHILDTVTPFLNDRTAEYLNALSDGSISAVWSTLGETAKGDVREKFNIDVENTKGGESFALMSGGEKRKARLATVLALQDLVASRATKNINLWIGDEIDDALDPAGLERLMGILERKARERGTVLVVSHNELTDWIDQTVTVTKSAGKSRVEGVLSV